jgi:hypothetical protein
MLLWSPENRNPHRDPGEADQYQKKRISCPSSGIMHHNQSRWESRAGIKPHVISSEHLLRYIESSGWAENKLSHFLFLKLQRVYSAVHTVISECLCARIRQPGHAALPESCNYCDQQRFPLQIRMIPHYICCLGPEPDPDTQFAKSDFILFTCGSVGWSWNCFQKSAKKYENLF